MPKIEINVFYGDACSDFMISDSVLSDERRWWRAVSDQPGSISHVDTQGGVTMGEICNMDNILQTGTLAFYIHSFEIHSKHYRILHDKKNCAVE